MRKKLILSFFVSSFLFFCLACHKKLGLDPFFVGQWYCEETPLQSEEYSGYLALDVTKNGSFSMYDWSGNPGISGKIETKGHNQIVLHCEKSEFTPPVTWENMSRQEKIHYTFKDENQLQLTYKDKHSESTLVFQRSLENF